MRGESNARHSGSSPPPDDGDVFVLRGAEIDVAGGAAVSPTKSFGEYHRTKSASVGRSGCPSGPSRLAYLNRHMSSSSAVPSSAWACARCRRAASLSPAASRSRCCLRTWSGVTGACRRAVGSRAPTPGWRCRSNGLVVDGDTPPVGVGLGFGDVELPFGVDGAEEERALSIDRSLSSQPSAALRPIGSGATVGLANPSSPSPEHAAAISSRRQIAMAASFASSVVGVRCSGTVVPFWPSPPPMKSPSRSRTSARYRSTGDAGVAGSMLVSSPPPPSTAAVRKSTTRSHRRYISSTLRRCVHSWAKRATSGSTTVAAVVSFVGSCRIALAWQSMRASVGSTTSVP
mmetsp:Transcript_6446/g.20259  ORF Transcript_6446/g.20259 Transcript_6446/m.20259 type:complete len:345 (+) Transcript_6446:1143-2177(+)